MEPEDRLHDLLKIKLDRGLEAGLERLRSANAYASGVLRGLTIINGGAIVALFTLVGDLSEKSGSPPVAINSLWEAFGWFVAGLVLAMVASLGAFASQNLYLQVDYGSAFEDFATLTGAEYKTPSPAYRVFGLLCEWTGIVTSVLSLIAFALGASSALEAGIAHKTAQAPAPAVSGVLPSK